MIALVIMLGAPVLIVTAHTRDVHASEQQKRRDTLIILRVWLATLLLMSAVAVTLHLPDAAPHTPTSIPTSTPTPRLARSITQVLTTFCDAINTQNYQTAWNQYTNSLQHTHSEPETFAARRKFTRCTHS
ncbi:MAG: hypothetical protein NVSMB27_20430 [Ktedonobacteraceae bacterium]